MEQDRILKKSFELFMRYGIRSVTMDDIARELGISKKTLYQTVDNKADLIGKLMQRHMQEEKEAMEAIRLRATDAIDEMLQIGSFVIERVSEITPGTIYDLQKYYQSLWRRMKKEMQEHVYGIIIDNLQRGIEQGLYRKELEPEIVALLYVGKSLLVTDEETVEACSGNMEKVHRELIRYHAYGITSASGRQLLEKHLLAQEKLR
ncbi:MAG: TetR family transcriptional regulator [Bacteroidetes bacterium]|nr:TetR family transcriptional regulator [Bacteroidota bacterium]